MATYNMDAQIGESSACATALLCGVKANYETVGLDSSARFENCNSSFDARVPSLINWAQEQGKSTGLVTTTRVTHATPAALYAHTASRYWEDDGKVPSGARTSCKDIARQLLEDEPGRNINVILGGGRRHFVPKVIQDPEEPDKEGRRLDGRNLIDEWSRNLRLRNVAAKYVANKEQLENVDPRKVNHLLGLFSYSHMDFDVDRNTNGSGDPSLAEMTIKALRILAKNPEGYFLFVEGGRIDHAHHYNNAYRALDETLALEEAVRAVMKEVDLSETLLVVTADHSHVLTLGGLATHRGNPILARCRMLMDNRTQRYCTATGRDTRSQGIFYERLARIPFRDECRNDIYEKTQWAVMSRLTKGIGTDVETALRMAKESNLRIQAARRDHDQAIRELRTSLTMQEKRTDALQSEITGLKDLLENAKEELEGERRSNSALKEQKETLKETLEDIRRHTSMLAGENNILQSQAVTLAESKLELERTVIGLRKEIDDTRDAYLETERRSTALLDESRKVNDSLKEEYEEKLEKLQREIVSLRSQISDKKDNERTKNGDDGGSVETIQDGTILKPRDDPVADMTQQLVSNREKIEMLSRQNDRLSKTLCRLKEYRLTGQTTPTSSDK
ncbi:PREDICTED: uncharacterized protein LOC108553326 [Eufriesea mexicana]|uniref:uncharacterized protein LOC108553326 n=1 Tax=Eufriesea mexicana TaxID=516756 RepID=UPI00083BEA77|nr:PREDICTED: uncharacterized protein LOC108553326 [Eufriesea mexicana]